MMSIPQRFSFGVRHCMPAPRMLTLGMLLAATLGLPAHARPSDALHAYAGLSYFHDDNLFRLADDQSINGVRSDSATQRVLGVFFDKMYGRQKVFLQAKRSKVAFSRFQQLDYDGKDYVGTLNWQLGNRFEGTLGGLYAQTLAPYTDFRSTERNLRVQKRQHGARRRLARQVQLRADHPALQ